MRAPVAKKVEKPSFKSFLYTLRKKRIIEILAGFIGGGWLILEFVHWILIDHYHFPEESLDIALVTLICALICTLTWRIFAGVKKRARKVKLELILIPLIILITAFFDVRLIQQIGEPEAETISEKKWKNSIAVLPFANISPEEGQEYFCDGMTDEIIAKLSTLKELKVVSRTSVMRYKNTAKSIKEIGQELDVASVLEGSVRKERDDIRITAQLISVKDGFQFWSDTYKKKLESVFAIQSDVAEKIANALQVELSPGEKEQLMEKPTENLLAYDYYLNGKALFYTYDKSNNEQAIVLFKRALDLDPSFSFAYSGLSKCYSQYINRQWDFDEKWLMLGEEAAKKAIELDNQSAEAYFALGFIHEQRNEYEEMEREMRNALKLNPNHAHAHDSLGDVMHRWHGNLEDALQEFNKALTLDPFLLPSHLNTYDIYVKQGKYGDAEQILLRSLEKQKNYDGSLWALGRLYRFMGKYEFSVEMLKKALTINPQGVTYHVDLGLTYLLQNNIDGAQAEAKFMVETFDDTPSNNISYHYLLGRILLEQGDFQSALQNFEQVLLINNRFDQSNQSVYRVEPEDIFKAITETYFRQGKFKEAIIELSRMNDLPVGSFQFEN